MDGPAAADGGRQAAAPARRRPAPSLRARLLGLVALLAGVLLALAALAVWQAHDAARARMEEQLLATGRAMALVVDQEFARAEALLQGVAALPGLAEGAAEAFLEAARRLDRGLEGVQMALAEAPGRQVANSVLGREAAGQPMPPALEEVFASGRTAITDLYRSSVDGMPVFAIAVPVGRENGAPPRLAIGLTLDRARFTASLRAQRLPEGAVAAVLDRQGLVVARTRREAEVLGRAAVPALRTGMARAPEGVLGHVVNHDGEVSVVAFARAPRSGYAVAVAVPEAHFAAERRDALLRLAAMGLPVAVAGLGLAALLAIRLRAALAGLSGGAGAPRLREVEDLAAALARSDAARARSETELRERNAWLEATQRAALVGTWTLDLRSGELRWSEGMWRLYGLDPVRDGPATVELFRARLAEEDRAAALGWVEAAKASGRYAAEFRIRRPDGALRWLRAQGVVEYAPDGTPARVLAANLDITEQKALEAERESLLVQKDLLVREVHHRVKNSLQLVQALLLMQARAAAGETGGAEAAAQLREAAGRIVTVAAVHRRLYEGATGEDQDAADHLAGLAEDLSASLGGAGRRVRVEAARGLTLPADRMAALGLLVTELVTNALKYGAGEVRVRLSHDAAGARLAVEDDGPGFPPGFDPAASRGLGMRIATGMARQLRGRLEVEPGPGGRVVVGLPLATEPA